MQQSVVKLQSIAAGNRGDHALTKMYSTRIQFTSGINVKSVIVMLCFLLASCGELTHTDVSDRPEYLEMIGKQFSVVGEIQAYGIRKHSGAPIDYVTLMPRPGIAGRSIVPLGTLRRDSVFAISAVQKASWNLDYSFRFQVKSNIPELALGVPIYIDLFRGNDGSAGDMSLNQMFYQAIPK